MNIFILLLMFSVLNDSRTILASQQQPESSALSVIDHLKEQDEHFHIARQKDVVLVLGITGSGKSTLTSILSDAELESIEVNKDEGSYRVEDKNDKISGISTTISRTIIPNLMVNERNGIAFYDCPGFVDSRGVVEELTVTFGIHKLLNFAESLKFLFAVPHSSLQVAIGDRLGFLELVQYAVQMIKDIEKYRDAIAMVVTKVPNTYISKDGQLKLVDDSTKIQAIANFLRQTRIDLMNKTPRILTENWRKNTDQQIKFIDILLEKNKNGYTRIGIMRLTSEPGLLSKMPLIQNEKNAILKIVNENLRFVHKEDDDFGYVISDKSKLQLNDLKDELNKGLIDNFNAINSEIRQSLIQKEIECSNSLNDTFTTFSKINQKLNEINSGEPKIFANHIMNVADTLRISTSTQQFKNFLKYIEIINIVQLFNTNKISLPVEIRNQVTDLKSYANNAQSWYNFMVHIREKLSEYDIQKKSQDSNGSILLNSFIGDENAEKPVNTLDLKTTMDCIDPQFYDQIKNLRVNTYKLKLLQSVWNQSMRRASIECSSDGEQLVAKGYNVLISNVIQSECWQSATNIKVFALNKVFIDADIDKPSTYLSIISPEWEIILNEETSTRQIKLNGVNGFNYTPIMPRGISLGKGIQIGPVDESSTSEVENSSSKTEIAEPGEPGMPGGPGGQFFGIGLTINGKRMEINVSGGDGSDGQDGGNGLDGENGFEVPQSKDFDFLNSFGTKCGKDTIIQGTYERNITQHFCGKPGTPGTDGFDGGCKGFGGNHGESQLIGLETFSNVAVLNHQGVNGKDGKGGLGGKGAANGRTFHIMTRMRGIGSITGIGHVLNPVFGHKAWYESTGSQPAGKNGTDGGNCHDIETKSFDFYNSHQTLHEYKQYGREHLAKNKQVAGLYEFLEFLGTLTDFITEFWEN